MAAEGKIATIDLTLPSEEEGYGSNVALLDEDPHLGTVLDGQYRIDELLGAGGMGAVYRATQLSVQRSVAVKLIAGNVERNPDYVQRFRREAEALAMLRHPNTVHLLDFGVTEERRLYMVMEMLSGHDLEHELATRGQLDLPQALSVVRQVAQSISEAHAFGIVHRDLKPSNVFLSQIEGGESFVKVMDFGVAGFAHDEQHSTLTVKGAVLGTAAYMSPEQAQGFEVDARADLYSLGVLLFEMVTGRTPFQANSAISMLIAHVSEAPPRLAAVSPRLPELESVQKLLDSLLAKAPEDRPGTAAEVIGMLDQLLADLGSLITGPTSVVVMPGKRRAQRRRGKFLAAALTFLAVAASATWIGWQRSDRLPQLRATAFLPALQQEAELVVGTVATAARQALDALNDQPVSSVTIATAPAGAMVRLAGAELGKTPYQMQLKSKTLVQLDLPGYELENITVDPAGEPNVSIKLTPAAPFRAPEP